MTSAAEPTGRRPVAKRGWPWVDPHPEEVCAEG